MTLPELAVIERCAQIADNRAREFRAAVFYLDDVELQVAAHEADCIAQLIRALKEPGR